MAENSVVVEARKLGEALVAAAAVVKKAQELQTKITGYEAQAERLKDTLTKDRQTLENVRVQIQDATDRLTIATEKTAGAEAERDRRVSLVAQEEETAIKQLRTLAQRDRDEIKRSTEVFLLELEAKKRQIQDELDGQRRTLEKDLRFLESNIENARQTLRRAREAHTQFVESISVKTVGSEAP